MGIDEDESNDEIRRLGIILESVCEVQRALISKSSAAADKAQFYRSMR